MKRFELVEGTSSKFWELALDGADVTVRFGRIGTNGQTKTKTHASAEAARKDHDKLVKEKTSGGYSEVGVAPGAMLAAVAAPPAPAASLAVAVAVATPPASAPIRAPSPAPAAAAAATSASTGDIAWPHGGFDWTDGLRASLPIVRGIHAPAFPDGRPLLAGRAARWRRRTAAAAAPSREARAPRDRRPRRGLVR